ncbi:MAG: PH domain-containing protein [Acidimicrobiia bacterium]
MGYPTKLLNEGENLVLDLQPHPWYFRRQILTSLPLLVLLIIAFQAAGAVGTTLKWAFGILVLAWAGWLVKKYFDWRYTHFVVTNQRVVFRTGVIAKQGVEIPLDRISNINFHQGIVDRMIGAGDLDIESAGRDGTSHFDDVRRPDDVQQEIYRQMKAMRQAPIPAPQPAPAPAPAAAPSVPDQIAQLAALRDQGHISAEEYEAKKAELLERM